MCTKNTNFYGKLKAQSIVIETQYIVVLGLQELQQQDYWRCERQIVKKNTRGTQNCRFNCRFRSKKIRQSTVRCILDNEVDEKLYRK
jgi:hypothetical protein